MWNVWVICTQVRSSISTVININIIYIYKEINYIATTEVHEWYYLMANGVHEYVCYKSQHYQH
jgi:hypothetical protein